MALSADTHNLLFTKFYDLCYFLHLASDVLPIPTYGYSDNQQIATLE